MKIHGIEVSDITYEKPGNSLPKWIREQAEARGFGDSKVPLSLYVQEADIDEAFECAAQGDGSSCVMAQAGRRIGAKSVYFYRTTAWVDFGVGPIVRFKTSHAIYNNVIEPFDRGDRQAVTPGIYHLTSPTPSMTLSAGRNWERQSRAPRGRSTGERMHVAHTERVVVAARKAS